MNDTNIKTFWDVIKDIFGVVYADLPDEEKDDCED